MLCALLLQLALEATSKRCALRCEHCWASSKQLYRDIAAVLQKQTPSRANTR